MRLFALKKSSITSVSVSQNHAAGRAVLIICLLGLSGVSLYAQAVTIAPVDVQANNATAGLQLISLQSDEVIPYNGADDLIDADRDMSAVDISIPNGNSDMADDNPLVSDDDYINTDIPAAVANV